MCREKGFQRAPEYDAQPPAAGLVEAFRLPPDAAAGS
jgi:hypothetical protein